MPSLTRRKFLRGVGACIALPALESLAAAPAAPSAAKRFVCVSPGYGMNPAGLIPLDTAANNTLQNMRISNTHLTLTTNQKEKI